MPSLPLCHSLGNEREGRARLASLFGGNQVRSSFLLDGARLGFRFGGMASLLVNQDQLMPGFDMLGRHRALISKFEYSQEADLRAGQVALIGQGDAEQERQGWIARIMPSFAAGLYSARWR